MSEINIICMMIYDYGKIEYCDPNLSGLFSRAVYVDMSDGEVLKYLGQAVIDGYVSITPPNAWDDSQRFSLTDKWKRENPDLYIPE